MLGSGSDGFAIAIDMAGDGWMECIASWGKAWDHVSLKIRLKSEECRTPTWSEMCYAKALFFHPTEWAVQYHPAEKDQVNNHPNVLHIWKPNKGTIHRPPKEFV